MSDLRIGLAVEGPTDAIVLEAGLSAFLDTSFIVVTLQPEVPAGKTGTGWGGVFWWCRQMASLEYATLSDSSILQHQDIVIIQIDADVAQHPYSSANIDSNPYDDLPCERPCPPATDTVSAMFDVVCGWLSPTTLGAKGIVCIPSKCIDTWAAAALYGDYDAELVEDLECFYGVEGYLQARPAKERLIRMHNGRFRKIRNKYERAKRTIAQRWASVKRYCPQAEIFQESVEEAIR